MLNQIPIKNRFKSPGPIEITTKAQINFPKMKQVFVTPKRSHGLLLKYSQLNSTRNLNQDIALNKTMDYSNHE